MIADCEPEPRVSLILAQQSFRVTVHCVEGSQVSIGRCPVGSWAALTLVWVVECPHPCSIIVILTPKVFFWIQTSLYKRRFLWCPTLLAACFSTPTYR